MSSAPVRGIVPQRDRRHHHHHHHHRGKHQRRHHNSEQNEKETCNQLPNEQSASIQGIENKCVLKKEDSDGKRPKVNPIFLWAAQCEQRIVEVRCEDYDKRNRIKLTKTAQGWRSIPRTALNACPTTGSATEEENEQQDILSTSSKNEEKENTSGELLERKELGIDEFQNTRIDIASELKKTDITAAGKERRKRKRKRLTNDSVDMKKKKDDSEMDESVNEAALITSNWKMKKRRKIDKDKKRKRLCIEEELAGELKIKEESKKPESTEKTNKSGIKEKDQVKKYLSNMHSVSDDDTTKSNGLRKLHSHRHLQPRVVLEQLHLSRLPTGMQQSNPVNKVRFDNDMSINNSFVETNTEKLVQDSVEDSDCNDADRIDLLTDEAVVDKEDLQEILNMLDSNHFPFNSNETKPNLIDSKDLSRNCTKLGATVLSSDQNDHIKIDGLLAKCAKQENQPNALEKRNKYGEKDYTKLRTGSKSLDETIQRLEKSINSRNRLSSAPDLSVGPDSERDEQAHREENSQSQNQSQSMDAILQSYSASGLSNDNTEYREGSEILNALRNTPGLTVSVAVNESQRQNVNTNLDTNLNVDHSLSRTSPDSQTEVPEKDKKFISKVPNDVQGYGNPPLTSSISPKNQVHSPESTVNFPKCERSQYEADTHGAIEDEDCHSQLEEEMRNQINCEKFSRECDDHIQEDYLNYYENGDKITKSKDQLQLILRNSEAQAKSLNLTDFRRSVDFDEQMIDDFQSQVSPQPSGLPYQISSRRPSSAYLERLLPSPPCSVSCSEDAKNDLTLKGILSSPNNIDSKDPAKKEQAIDSNLHVDSDMSHSYNLAKSLFPNKNLISENIAMPSKKQKFLHDLSDIRRDNRPMSHGDVTNSYTPDYVYAERPLSAELTGNQQRIQNSRCFAESVRDANQNEFIHKAQIPEPFASPQVFLDPATQLRELLKTSGHLIPDPLLVPRDYLPLLAGAPLTEIPKLLTARPELRLPEALTRPELLRDPDLLVISLAHLQHVLDHGEAPINRIHQSKQPLLSSPTEENKSVAEQTPKRKSEEQQQQRPKLSCKPIGKLMPAPIDLSNSYKSNSQSPLLRVRSGLLKQEPEVSSTANSPDDSQLWHPLFGSQKQRQQHELRQEQQRASWHRTTLAS